jgi:Protein of unknown function (DUF3563)
MGHTMSNFTKLIQAFLPRSNAQQERDEAYLNDSVDIYDLERRMVEIDRRKRNVALQTPAFIFSMS